MADTRIHSLELTPIRPLTPTAPTTAKGPVEGRDFQSYLMDSLAQVNRLQQEANAGVERLATGQTDNLAEVFSATRKAGVAFDLLMEIRNKLMDAYTELKQMRV